MITKEEFEQAKQIVAGYYRQERFMEEQQRLESLKGLPLAEYPIEDAPISTRALGCLKRLNEHYSHHIKQVKDLALVSGTEVMLMRNAGKATLQELKAVARQAGVSLKF